MFCKKSLIKLYNCIKIVFSILLLLSCIHNCVYAAYIVCLLEICNSSTSKMVWALFPRVVATTCMISRFMIIYNNINEISKYKTKIKNYELHFPVNTQQENFHRFFIIILTTTCIILILSTNIYRIILLYYHVKRIEIIILHLLMYVQNFSMCVTELQFVGYCFGLFLKFKSINEEMSIMKLKTINANKYPLILKPDDHIISHCVGLDCNDDLCWRIKVQPVAGNTVELLKMRHQFVSNAVKFLNEMYGIQLGLSLCTLFLMSLFDIYDVVSGDFNVSTTNVLLYGWVMQYSFRFCMIVLIPHATTKQVIKINL